MIDERASTLSEERIINDLTKGRDLTNPNDIKKVFIALQSCGYTFTTQKGREFDDYIFDLMEKVKSGEIKEAPANNYDIERNGRKNSNSSAKKNSSKSTRSGKSSDRYGDSIDSLVAIELKKREKRRGVILVALCIIAILSLGYFIAYYYMSSRTSSDYESLSNLKGSEALSNAVDNNSKNNFGVHKKAVVTPDILDEYKTLYAKNNKLAGWLKIDGTKIDYPVMQTSDNEYYLSHNFNQEKDNNGSLFLDCECSVFPKSTNMIIYGHHMKSGNMFGYLQKYAKESYWKEHPVIQFDTIYEKGTYSVMYAFYSKVYDNDDLVFKYYQFIDANSATEFDYYMSQMEELSLYDTGIKASYGDTLLTLSTCDHSQTDGRFAVVAKKIN